MLRARRDWTLATLAEKSGLSASYLSLVESGKREISLQGGRVIAEAFGIPFITLLALSIPASQMSEISVEARSKLREALMLLVEELGEPSTELPAPTCQPS